MTKGSAESVGMSAARLERIGPAMQAYVDSGIYAGVSTIVARRGVVVHEGQYGLRDREAVLPMTEDTIFRLYVKACRLLIKLINQIDGLPRCFD